MSLDPLKKLAGLTRDIGQRLGLTQTQFGVIVDADTGEAKLNLMFSETDAAPAAALTDDEKAAFDDMANRMRDDAQAVQLEESKQDLQNLLRNPKRGFLEES